MIVVENVKQIWVWPSTNSIPSLYWIFKVPTEFPRKNEHLIYHLFRTPWSYKYYHIPGIDIQRTYS